MCKIGDIIIAIFLVVVAYIDFRTRQIPVKVIGLFGLVCLILRIAILKDSLLSTVCGILIGLLFLGMSKVTRESIGYGDGWLILFLGIYLGGRRLLEMMLFACILAGVAALIQGLLKGWKKNRRVAFVPFLAAACLGVMFR